MQECFIIPPSLFAAARSFFKLTLTPGMPVRVKSGTENCTSHRQSGRQKIKEKKQKKRKGRKPSPHIEIQPVKHINAVYYLGTAGVCCVYRTGDGGLPENVPKRDSFALGVRRRNCRIAACGLYG